jgi:membrane protein
MAVGQEEIMQQGISFATEYLEKTKGGLMAIIGILFLGYIIFKLMGHMENTFNKIW